MPPPSRQILRRVLAVFAGIVAVAALSIGADSGMRAIGQFPPLGQPMSSALFLVATLYRMIFGILGCYLAALLAPFRPMWHAMAVGVVGLILSAIGLVTTWNHGPEFGPKWYPIALVVTALPCAWVGGKLPRGERTQ